MTTTLYPGIPFSPQATITNNIGAADSIIEVSDVSAFPPAPNLATIGTDEEGETILYTAKTETALSGCQRGVEGTARAWTAGELIGRNFTARDHADLIAAATEAYGAAEAAQEAAGNAMGAAQEAAATAGAVAASKQPKLTGAPGQAVGFAADGTAVAVPGWSNPNLLLNWDFRNPVNRNGKTEYTGTGYTIDRFKIGYSAGSTFTCGVEDNGVSLTAIPKEGETSQFNFYQIIPANLLNQGTYTLSFLYSSDCAVRPFAYSQKIGSVIPGYKDFPASNDPAIAVIPIKITSEMQGGDVNAYVQINTFVEAHVKLYAAKLELGTQQTLARQNDDGEWEIIDPLNYDLQYALCSLYSPITGKWVGSQHSNLNLMDNWYFIGGGSQQGGGQLPINQRGQTEYVGAGYTIDRWNANGYGKIELGSDGIVMTRAGTYYRIVQKFDDYTSFAGKTVTLSMLMDADLFFATFTIGGTGGDGVKIAPNINVYSLGESLPLAIQLNQDGSSGKIKAVKLELGAQQTLAHQDADGNWVLNDPPPNKALELAKCQRYAKIFRQHEVFTVLRVNPNYIDFLVPVGIKMRSTPTIIGTGWGEYLTNGFTLTVAVNGASQIMLRATKTNHGLSNPSPMTMRDSVSGFSSDL